MLCVVTERKEVGAKKIPKKGVKLTANDHAHGKNLKKI